jgi:hypothetical protein
MLCMLHCHMLHATCHMPHAATYMLHAGDAGYMPHYIAGYATCWLMCHISAYMPHVTCHMLHVACFTPYATCCHIAGAMPHATCHMLTCATCRYATCHTPHAAFTCHDATCCHDARQLLMPLIQAITPLLPLRHTATPHAITLHSHYAITMPHVTPPHRHTQHAGHSHCRSAIAITAITCHMPQLPCHMPLTSQTLHATCH